MRSNKKTRKIKHKKTKQRKIKHKKTKQRKTKDKKTKQRKTKAKKNRNIKKKNTNKNFFFKLKGKGGADPIHIILDGGYKYYEVEVFNRADKNSHVSGDVNVGTILKVNSEIENGFYHIIEGEFKDKFVHAAKAVDGSTQWIILNDKINPDDFTIKLTAQNAAKFFRTLSNNTIANKLRAKSLEEKAKILPKVYVPPPPSIANPIANPIKPDTNETEAQQLATTLTKTCPDSGLCLALGQQVDDIKKLFNQFDFKYADLDGIKKGESGENGFTLQIPFIRHGYTCNALLKSQIDPKNDNLFYEAFVGVYINTKVNVYPCFVETYGCYEYKEDTLYNYLKSLQRETKMDTNQIKSFKELTNVTKDMTYNIFSNNELIKKSCEKPESFCILIQYIRFASTILDEIKKNMIKDHTFEPYISPTYKPEFISYHLMQYLYQIYCPLSAMNKYEKFIHHDLNPENVLIYKPGKKNKDDDLEYTYITMKYHYEKDMIIFNTFGIVKIIDYGGCEIPESQTKLTVYREEKKCNNILQKLEKKFNANNSTNEYIQQLYRNNLYLINRIAPNILGLDYKNQTGTQIKTVQEMHEALKKYIQGNAEFKQLNTSLFAGKTCLGTMDVWVDGKQKMKYTPTKTQTIPSPVPTTISNPIKADINEDPDKLLATTMTNIPPYMKRINFIEENLKKNDFKINIEITENNYKKYNYTSLKDLKNQNSIEDIKDIKLTFTKQNCVGTIYAGVFYPTNIYISYLDVNKICRQNGISYLLIIYLMDLSRKVFNTDSYDILLQDVSERSVNAGYVGSETNLYTSIGFSIDTQKHQNRNLRYSKLNDDNIMEGLIKNANKLNNMK